MRLAHENRQGDDAGQEYTAEPNEDSYGSFDYQSTNYVKDLFIFLLFEVVGSYLTGPINTGL